MLDISDASEHADITRLGVTVHVTDTLVPPAARPALAREVLDLARGLAAGPAGRQP
ncbi:MAG: hypothetical protein ACRDQA_15140 [Nocardioidaceae bacterium]